MNKLYSAISFPQTFQGILLLLVCLFGASVTQANTLRIELNGDLITIEAVNASLKTIADRISTLTGIPVGYTDGKDDSVTTSIFEEPLTKVVAKLSANNVIRTKNINGVNVITEVMFLLSDDQGRSSDNNLPSGAPVDEVVVEEPTYVEDEPVENLENQNDLASELEPNQPTQ